MSGLIQAGRDLVALVKGFVEMLVAMATLLFVQVLVVAMYLVGGYLVALVLLAIFKWASATVYGSPS